MMLSAAVQVPKETRVYDEGDQSVGYGFFLRDTPHGLLVEHGGNNRDFDCKFGLYPETGDGYVIFTNGNVGDELVRTFERFWLVGRL